MLAAVTFWPGGLALSVHLVPHPHLCSHTRLVYFSGMLRLPLLPCYFLTLTKPFFSCKTFPVSQSYPVIQAIAGRDHVPVVLRHLNSQARGILLDEGAQPRRKQKTLRCILLLDNASLKKRFFSHAVVYPGAWCRAAYQTYSFIIRN